MLTLEDLRYAVELGELDTVVVAFTDMQGRLMGKRLHAEFFVEEMEAGHSVEGCNYLLALEMEMEPVPGYAMASWEQGYGDFDLVPDLTTMRRIPWLEGLTFRREGSENRRNFEQVQKARVYEHR
jgi:glutamine synthetase